MADQHSADAPDGPPKIFISYTHESRDHKRWVSVLATSLRESGVDAGLDQWDIDLGRDTTLFMENGIRGSDRVLLICTPTYAQKANEGEGGVGYERLVVTGEIAEKIDTNKFICVLRDGSKDDSIPIFAKTRLFIDFRDDAEYDVRLEDLLRDIHQAPATPKPQLGANPYIGEAGRTPPNTRRRPHQSEISYSTDTEEIFSKAETLLRERDLLGWKRLLRQTRRQLGPALIEWRGTVGEGKLDPQEWPKKMDEAVSVAAPLFVLALSAVDSEIDSVRDQRGLIPDFLSIENWVSSGRTVLVSVPEGLAYLYHNLLGAMLVDSEHHHEAIDLLMTNVRYSRASISEPLWVRSDLTGWPTALGGNCTDAWKYLSELPTSCSWVGHFFTSGRSFREANQAYLLMGSLLELAHAIKCQTNLKELAQLPRVQVPPWFLLTENFANIIDRAIPSSDALADLASRNNVEPQALRDHWSDWCTVLASWTSSVGIWQLPFRDSIPELP